MKDRINELKLMHETMQSMNDTEAYYSWIYTMPDCPTEDDFEFIARDKESYEDTVNAFKRIMNNFAHNGLYQATPEVFAFARQFQPQIINLE